MESSSSCFPPGHHCIKECMNLLEAVAIVGHNERLAISRSLGVYKTAQEREDIRAFCSDVRPSYNLHAILDTWSETDGSEATVDRLLKACQDAKVSLHEVEEEFLRREGKAKRCAAAIRPDIDLLESLSPREELSLGNLPPNHLPVYEDEILQFAVAEVGQRKWEEVSLALGFKRYEVSDIPRSYDNSFDKLHLMITRFAEKKYAKDGTIGRLLKACKVAGVSLSELDKEYLRLKLLLSRDSLEEVAFSSSSEHLMSIGDTGKGWTSEIFPPSDRPAFQCVSLCLAIGEVGGQQWRKIFVALGWNPHRLRDCPWGFDCVDKLLFMVNKWLLKEKSPTVGQLLNACQAANISKNVLERELSKQQDYTMNDSKEWSYGNTYAFRVLHRLIRDDDLKILSLRIASSWLSVARALGGSPLTESEIDSAKSSNAGPANQCFAMFQKWIDKQPVKVTVYLLCTALIKAGWDSVVGSVYGHSVLKCCKEQGDDVRMFATAMDEDTSLLIRARLHIVGKDGAGKTCVRNALLGKEFVEGQESTGGIATEVAVCCAEGSDTGEPWNLSDKRHTRQQIGDVLFSEERAFCQPKGKDLRSAFSFLEGDKKAESPAWTPVQTSVGTPRAHRTDLAEPENEKKKIEENIVVQSTEKEDEVLKAFRMSVQSVVPHGKSEPVQSTVIIWDEGGQEQYLNMQTPFIAKDAVHFLAFDLTKGPNEKVTSTDLRRADGSVIKQRSYYFKTYGEVIRHWLSMMSLSTVREPSTFDKYFKDKFSGEDLILRMGEAFIPKRSSPPCMLIGTRSGDKDAKIKEYSDYFADLFKSTQLRKLAGHLVKSDDGRWFFPVECSSIEDRDSTFKEIRKKVTASARLFWNQKRFPNRWLLLLLLTEEVSKQLAILQKSSLYRQYAYALRQQECSIPDRPDFELALKYLDWLGLVIHKPDSGYEVLSDCVITDPSWLFDLFSNFLPIIPEDLSSDLPVEDEKQYPEYREDLGMVQQEGKMCFRLANFLLSQVKKTELHPEQILRVLQDFDVLAFCAKSKEPVEVLDNVPERLSFKEGEFYYVPCLVQNDLDDSKCFIKQTTPSMLCTPPLVLMPKEITFWPEPLYFRLATRLLNKYHPKPGKAIVERRRVVLNDVKIPDVEETEYGLSLELVYVDRLYVAVTVRYDSEEERALVNQNCRALRKELRREVVHVKQLGFEGFRYSECMVKNQDTPTLSSKEGDMYTDLANRLKFKKRGRVYYDDGRDEGPRLESCVINNLLYWYGSDKEQAHVKEMTEDGSAAVGKQPRKPTGPELADLAPKITGIWKSIATRLGLSHAEKNTIAIDNKDNVSQQALEMLGHWIEKEGKSATVAALIASLRCEKAGGIAEEVFRELV